MIETPADYRSFIFVINQKTTFLIASPIRRYRSSCDD
jgi:hypothetical protein